MSSSDNTSLRISSTTSVDARATETTGATTPLHSNKSSKFDFWQRHRSVAPATVSLCAPDEVNDNSENTTETLLFLNNPSEFDFRSFFRRTSSAEDGATSPVQKEKRRLRAREELCLMVSKTAHRAKKSWFLSPGFIGRENGEHTLVATKEPSMDPIHAEILVDGDDYLIRDNNSSSGTFLCLTTINRHHPQRDGFRLRNGDLFWLGLNAKVVVHDVCTVPSLTRRADVFQQKLLQLAQHAVEPDDDEDAESPETPHPESNGSTANKLRHVHFGAVADAADGSSIVGNRYKRKKKKVGNAYVGQTPVSLNLSLTVRGKEIHKELHLFGKQVYLIGSSPMCDIHVAADGVHPVHARIVFDGFSFLLQDLSFEENPKRKTRVSLHQPTRIGRGDCLLFGTCVLHVVSVYRAFRDHEPDMKEVAFKCHMLRPSKRKSRVKEKYIPFGFRHHAQDPFVFGKGRHCEGHIFTAALNVEQFAIQLSHGSCSLVPRAGGINQGVYFLLGRDCIPHEATYRSDFVRYTSKALMLVEGSVFKCGNTEIEVVYVKNEAAADVAVRADEVRENALLLGSMPWIQQIAKDRHGIENVAKRGQRLQLQSGDAIYDEGDPATFLFIVVSGEVELVARRNTFPQSWRLSLVEGYLTSFDSGTESVEPHTEQVATGSFFGEVCLRGLGLEYSENAKALSDCMLLAISREDICGYFSHYMDIIMPHLEYESHKKLLQKLRLHVPWLRDLSYQELRILASKAEYATYEQGDAIVENGLFKIDNISRTDGLLLLGYGRAELLGKSDPEQPSNDRDTLLQLRIWEPNKPILSIAECPLEGDFYNVRARSRVECYYLDAAHISHLVEFGHDGRALLTKEDCIATSGLPRLRRASSNRRSSFATLQQRSRHSQVVLTSAPGADDEEHHLENVDMEDLNDPAQKWRRKKRNKNSRARIAVISTSCATSRPSAASSATPTSSSTTGTCRRSRP